MTYPVRLLHILQNLISLLVVCIKAFTLALALTYGLGLNILALTTSLNLGTVAPVRQNIYVLPCMSS